jgi:hypothetical protein
LANHTKFVDKRFLPEKEDVVAEPKFKEFVETRLWVRAEEHFQSEMLNNSKHGHLIQCHISDCYLVATVSAIAERESVLKQHFLPVQLRDAVQVGAACVIFNYCGVRMPIAIDTLIPLNKDRNLQFNRTKSNDSSWWFVLVEKAFAKCCSGYSNIHNKDSTHPSSMLNQVGLTMCILTGVIHGGVSLLEMEGRALV